LKPKYNIYFFLMKLSQLYEKAEHHFKPDTTYTREEILEFIKPTKKIKRCMSPYQLFLSDKKIQEKIKSEHPNADFGERSKLLADMWSCLEDEDKTPYNTRAAQLTPPKKKKRAPTAYNLFIKDSERRKVITDKNPDTPQKDIMRLLAAEWKTLSDTDKTPYQTESDKLKQQITLDS
jgi:hypothetical protein